MRESLSRATDVSFDEAENSVKISVLEKDADVGVELVFESLGIIAEEYTAIELEYMIPTSNSQESYKFGLYLMAGEHTSYNGSIYAEQALVVDGEYHTATFSLEGVDGWSGMLKKIRVDYFQRSVEVGDSIYIKSLKLIK